MLTWMPSPNAIAQCSHFFIATTIFLAARACGLDIAWSMLLILMWALPKEFIFDLVIERDSFTNSVEDCQWYMIGGIAALVFDIGRIVHTHH